MSKIFLTYDQQTEKLKNEKNLQINDIPYAKEILRQTSYYSLIGEYIFMRNGKRLTSRQINYVLEKYAERFDLQVKSSHKLRKTYASMCNANGVPIDLSENSWDTLPFLLPTDISIIR